MSDSLNDKISRLTSKINELEQRSVTKENCFPVVTVIGIIIPFAVALIFYIFQPKVVQRQEGDKFVRDGKKVAIATCICSFIGWALLVLYTYTTGYRSSKLCAV